MTAEAFLRQWAEACADRLRQQGHVGTDEELAALYAEAAGPEALAADLRAAPGWPEAGVCAALAAGGLEPVADAAVLAALALACAGAGGARSAAGRAPS